MTSSNLQIVLFILIKEKKILMEKRPVVGFSSHQYLFPGGSVQKELSESLEDALKREMMEELGITPIKFELLTEEDVPGLYDNILKPFVITKWQGEVPAFILDKKDPYPLGWMEIDKALNIPIKSTKEIVMALKVYLKDKDKTFQGLKNK